MAKSNKAAERELGDLHAELAKVLKGALSKDYTSESNPQGVPPAAILNVARQFLKDNLIVADPNIAPEDGNLIDLPVFDDDDEITHHRAH